MAGLRVLELDSDVATAFAGWWLRELGADVAFVTDDDVHGSSLDVARQFRHRSSPTTVQQIAATNQRFDVVIGTEHSRRAAGDDIAEWLPESGTIVSISGPECAPGVRGCSALTYDWQLWARSGLAYLTRELTADGDFGAPCFPANHQPSLLAGTVVALTAIASRLPKSDGSAPSGIRTFTVDRLELLATLPMAAVATAQIEQRIVGEADGTAYPGGVVPASDGDVYIRPVEPAHWERLLELVGDPEWVTPAALADRRFLLEARGLIDEALRKWSRTRSKQEIVDTAQAAHIPLAPMNQPADVLADPHLQARGFFDDERAGTRISVPWEITERLGAQDVHVPEPSESARVRPTSGLPLDGVRVLDLTWAWAGPFATTLLADLGAEVVNVEWHPRASNMRTQPPFSQGHEESPNSSGWWSANQRGKLSVGINLKHPDGISIVRELARVADVAIENFSPGVVDRLGIGADDLATVNPNLAYVSMAAFGKHGPHSHYIGYGPHLYAASGAAYAVATTSGRPAQMLFPYPDPVAGMAGALASLAYLYASRSVGRAWFADVSDLEATCCALADMLAADQAAFHDSDQQAPIVLRCADDVHVAVLESPREAEELLDSIVRSCAKLTSTQVAEALSDASIAWVLIQHSSDVLTDPYLVERQFWTTDSSPEIKPTSSSMAGPMWLIDGHRPAIWRGAPQLFADTQAVLTSTLNYAQADVKAFETEGVVHER